MDYLFVVISILNKTLEYWFWILCSCKRAWASAWYIFKAISGFMLVVFIFHFPLHMTPNTSDSLSLAKPESSHWFSVDASILSSPSSVLNPLSSFSDYFPHLGKLFLSLHGMQPLEILYQYSICPFQSQIQPWCPFSSISLYFSSYSLFQDILLPLKENAGSTIKRTLT